MLAALGGAAVAGFVAVQQIRDDPARLGPAQDGAAQPGLPAVPPYVPVPGEVFPKAKTAAARFVEALLTYGADEPAGASLDRALVLAAAGTDRAVLAQRSAAVLVAQSQSTGQVVYPQLGGLVPLGKGATYAVVMVVVTQRLLTSDGERRETTRTVDVRLRVVDGSWRVDELGSVGGDPVPRPASLPRTARRVLDDPRVALPDSARWDLHSGVVDGRVVDHMAEVADYTPYSVAVVRSGHPETVVDGFGDRRSNHFLGRAVDVWATDGVPIVGQRGSRDSLAYRLLEQVIAPGPADEIGVPDGWDLDGPVRRLFDNAVHDDHFHLGFRR